MGDSQVIDYFPERKKEDAQKTYGEIARELCPDYLAMGMTIKEYWEGDPEDYVSIRKAHRMIRKQANFDAWLNGFYIYHALQRVSPLYRDWVKDHRPEPYFDEPVELYKDEEIDKRMEERLEDERELANQATIKAWVDKVNRLMEQKDKKEVVSNG